MTRPEGPAEEMNGAAHNADRDGAAIFKKAFDGIFDVSKDEAGGIVISPHIPKPRAEDEPDSTPPGED